MIFDYWIAFVFAATLILIIPGPTVVYAVGESVLYGRKAIMPLSLGVLCGDAVCISFSLFGLGVLLAASATLFAWVKMVGAGYLLYLGARMIRSGVQIQSLNQHQHTFSAKALGKRAFMITALNPKGIIFFSAFMPQFVNPAKPLYPQFALLGVTFLLLAMINIVLYTRLAGKCSELFESPRLIRWFGSCGGAVLITAGILTLRMDRNG